MSRVRNIFLIVITLLLSVIKAQAQSHNASGYDLYLQSGEFKKEHVPLIDKDVEMIPYRKGDSFGFVSIVDKTKWLIKPQYLQVYSVHKEGAVVRNKRGFGLIDKDGKVLIPLQYRFLLKEGNYFKGYYGSRFFKNDTMSSDERKTVDWYQYFSKTGDWLAEQLSDEQETYSGNDTINWFKRDKLYYIMGIHGSVVDSFLYNDSNKFLGVYDNLLLYSKIKDTTNLLRAYNINRELKFSLSTKFTDVPWVFCKISQDLYGAVYSDNTYLFFDRDGELIPYGSYSAWVGVYLSNIGYFRQKKFIVSNVKGRKGVINSIGKVVVPFIYNSIGTAINGMHFCRDTNDQYSFVDTSGEIVLNLKSGNANEVFKHFRFLQQWVGFYEGLCIGYKELLGDYEGDIIFIPDGAEQKDSKQKVYEVIPEERKDLSYYYFFDKTGKTVLKLDPSIIFVGVFSSGLAPAMNKQRKVGFINKKGEWIIQPKYGIMYKGSYLNEQIVVPYFIGSYAYIKTHKGYIDKEGNEYFEGEFEQDHYNFSH